MTRIHSYHPAYFETLFRCEGPPPSFPEAFAIISACATTGESWTAEREREADEALRRGLATQGIWHHRIVGYAPDGSHEELSWCAELDLDAAREVGRRFLQDAIYVVLGDALQLVACEGALPPVEVGSFRARLGARSESPTRELPEPPARLDRPDRPDRRDP
jgi:hypothetical protein